MKTEQFPKMLAWAEKHDSHGLVLTNVFWLPEGDKPELLDRDYVRLEQFDLPAGSYPVKIR